MSYLGGPRRDAPTQPVTLIKVYLRMLPGIDGGLWYLALYSDGERLLGPLRAGGARRSRKI